MCGDGPELIPLHSLHLGCQCQVFYTCDVLHHSWVSNCLLPTFVDYLVLLVDLSFFGATCSAPHLTTFLTPTHLFLYFLDNQTFKFTKIGWNMLEQGFPAMHANFHRNRTKNI